ncbi:hypothetical protein vseg_000475 [Gypsophila vaccaria]
MAGEMSKYMAIIAVGVLMLINGVASKELIVGGDEGWSLQTSETFYQEWAAEQNFVVDDTLVFNFDTDFHTVAILTSLEAYNSCNADSDDNPEVVTEGPYKRNLNSPGQFYFICTIGSHCANGLKFAANVSANLL